MSRCWITIKQFIEQGGNQIVSLGAGFDTTYWLLKDAYPETSLKYVELDYPEVCLKKMREIARHVELQNKIPNPATDGKIHTGSKLTSDSYYLLPSDLRDTSSTLSSITQVLNPSLPTLFISECVLVYLDSPHSDRLISQISQSFPNSAYLNYDIIEPNDTFGRTMLENLSYRNIFLRGIHAYPSVQSQVGRFRQYFERVQGFNMLSIYNEHLPAEEKQRVERLEWMDEFEEWNLLLSHYVMLISCKGSIHLEF